MVRTSFVAATMLLAMTTESLSFDGWHLARETVINSSGSSWDYSAIDESNGRLFIGHRKKGLQVYDTATGKIVGTIGQTAANGANGPLLLPEFDLGISNNQNGTITPFKLSTLEAGQTIKVGNGIDSSFYDPATKRVFVNMESDKDGTGLIVLQVPELTQVGTIRVPTKKPEFSAADGIGNYYMASRDLSIIYKIDTRAMKVVAEWPVAPGGCGGANNLALDVINRRIFIGCRGDDALHLKPSFTVVDQDSGKVISNTEVGGGMDGMVYDADLKRIFVMSGYSAVMYVFEQVDANTYKPVEALGTASNARTLAMDHKTKKLYSMTAEGTADFSKRNFSHLIPWYPNTFFPDTFRVLEHSK